jgi:endonuclease G
VVSFWFFLLYGTMESSHFSSLEVFMSTHKRSKFHLMVAMAALVCLNLFSSAHAADCAAQLYQGKAPVVPTQMQNKAQYVCSTGYTVLHSGITKTPLFSAEHLTRDRIEQAKDLVRVDSFHPEASLPADQRAELRDYARSGYDRGHLAPNKDMSDVNMQQDSFSLANMVPQDPNNNRVLWEGIESATRKFISNSQEGYVVSGPAFIGNQILRIGNNVFVPTNLWKAVYIPSKNITGVYWVNNAPGDFYETISVSELYRRTGVDPFPTLPAATKATAGALPKPARR